ncbi:MAG: CopG family ribbon-helix-helix protein [Chloroflexota bacterium]
MTLQLPEETQAGLKALAEATGREPNMLALEAVQRYLEYDAWFVAEMEQAIKEADAGDFVSEQEMEAVFRRLGAARD